MTLGGRRRLVGVSISVALIAVAAWALVTNPVGPTSGVVLAVHPADAQKLSAHVSFLSKIDPPRAHPEGMRIAAAYVRGEWEKLGARVTSQVVPVTPYAFENLIVSYGPAGGSRIVVGAHYDCYGRNPGADDNASGTAALLELARMLKENAPSLSTGIDLVAFSSEEPPYFATDEMGSAVHAKSLREAGVKLRYMMSLEMLGDFSDAPGTQEYPLGLLKLFYPTVGNFIALIGRPGEWSLVRDLKARMLGAKTIGVKSMNAPAAIEGIDWSDHRNYWLEGYRAVMVTDTSFFRNHRYHTPDDTADKLDYRRMAAVVDAVYTTVVTP